MPYPTIIAVNGGEQPTDLITATINLPDGSDVAGRLLLLFFTCDGNGETFTLPANWTKILVEGGTGFTNAVYYKVIDGTEGYPATGATITVTITSVEQSCHTTYLISGLHKSSVPVTATATTGASTSPDSGSLNPAGWDVEDTLWFSFTSLNGLSATTPRISAYPASYSGGRSDISTGGNGCVQAVAYRENTVAAEDPGAFTSDTSADWRATTVGVRPWATATETFTGTATDLPDPPWTGHVDYYTIQRDGTGQGRPYMTDESVAFYTGIGFSDDQYSQVKIKAAGNNLSPCVRGNTGATGTCYWVNISALGRLVFGWYDGGFWNELDAQTGLTALSVDDVIKLEVSGWTLTCKVNGTQRGNSYTDTEQYVASGSPGLDVWGDSRFDDWEGGDLVADEQGPDLNINISPETSWTPGVRIYTP